MEGVANGVWVAFDANSLAYNVSACSVHFNEWLAPADDLLSKDYEQHVRAIISQDVHGMGVNGVTITLHVK